MPARTIRRTELTVSARHRLAQRGAAVDVVAAIDARGRVHSMRRCAQHGVAAIRASLGRGQSFDGAARAQWATSRDKRIGGVPHFAVGPTDACSGALRTPSAVCASTVGWTGVHRRPRVPWSCTETQQLRALIARFGVGAWGRVLKYDRAHDRVFMSQRTAVDLKDRHRVLAKQAIRFERRAR